MLGPKCSITVGSCSLTILVDTTSSIIYSPTYQSTSFFAGLFLNTKSFVLNITLLLRMKEVDSTHFHFYSYFHFHFQFSFQFPFDLIFICLFLKLRIKVKVAKITSSHLSHIG